jgi:hypothetical protein
MVAMMDSREAIFTIELPDGQVYTGVAMAVSFSEDCQVEEVRGRYDSDTSLFSAGPAVWEIELRGIGPLAVKGYDMFHDLLKEGSRALEESEWTCPYCGRSWPHSQRTCWDGVHGCGANRPAMWWV